MNYKGSVQMKRCKLCGEERQDQFYASRNTRCKACVKRKQYEFNANNPEYLKAKNQRRRARKLALPNTLTKEQWKSVLDRFGNRCCLTNSTDISLEHVIPLENMHLGTQIENVIPLDRTLNLSKGAKNFIDWVQQPEFEEIIDWKKFYATMKYLADLNGMSSLQEYYEFIYWCEDNKRTIEEVTAATKSSVELFKESK